MLAEAVLDDDSHELFRQPVRLTQTRIRIGKCCFNLSSFERDLGFVAGLVPGHDLELEPKFLLQENRSVDAVAPHASSADDELSRPHFLDRLHWGGVPNITDESVARCIPKPRKPGDVEFDGG